MAFVVRVFDSYLNVKEAVSVFGNIKEEFLNIYGDLKKGKLPEIHKIHSLAMHVIFVESNCLEISACFSGMPLFLLASKLLVSSFDAWYAYEKRHEKVKEVLKRRFVKLAGVSGDFILGKPLPGNMTIQGILNNIEAIRKYENLFTFYQEALPILLHERLNLGKQHVWRLDENEFSELKEWLRAQASWGQEKCPASDYLLLNPVKSSEDPPVYVDYRAVKDALSNHVRSFVINGRKYPVGCFSLEIDRDMQVRQLIHVSSKLLDIHFANCPRCAISNKPIRFLALPNSAGAAGVYYEKSVLEAWIANQPQNAPPRWPLNALPLPLNASYMAADEDLQEFIDNTWGQLQPWWKLIFGKALDKPMDQKYEPDEEDRKFMRDEHNFRNLLSSLNIEDA